LLAGWSILGMTEWLIALTTLTAMEIVLGVDNVVFLAIIVGRLPVAAQPRVRWIGIGLAAAMRIALILSITWIMGLTTPVFHWTSLGIPESWLKPNPATVSIEDEEEAKRLHAAYPGLTDQSLRSYQQLKAEERFREINGLTWRDVILLGGGLFLIFKSVMEIHAKLEAQKHDVVVAAKGVGYVGAIVQIILIDLVFSLDSVITAVGMVKEVAIMIIAMLLAVGIMVAFAGHISEYIERRPTMKILALAFLILIGVLLVADGFGQHLDRGYVYFAMAFAVGIEMLNQRLRPKYTPDQSTQGPEG
jgi:predicted tellurium resistance membrane protein TerC